MTGIHHNALPVLAGRINAEHAAAEDATRRGMAHAVEAGRLLIEAKGQQTASND